MRFEILTLFPEMLTPFFETSMLGRAAKNGIIEANCVNIRDYSLDKHRKTDDTPFGGGFGMVMTCQPAVDALRDAKRRVTGSYRTIYMSPQGKPFCQKKAQELALYDNLIIFCGHYEGVDERIIQLEIDEEISAGDYVLTGGELPAAIVADAVSRLIPGVLPSPECYRRESFGEGLLEHPQYTKPREFEGLCVPDVLFSGNHAQIEQWKREQMLLRTEQKRPDLLSLFKNGEH